MTTTTFEPTEAPAAVPPDMDSRRCRYRFNNGMRCRLPVSSSQSGLCPQHFRETVSLPELPNDATDLSADLLPAGTSEFSSADDIRQFLARLLAQVTRGRISPRRAAVLAFITNQLLHSHSAIHKEVNAHNEADEPQRIIIDMPGPTRD